MLLKCCTQNVSKSGKLIRGHRTGKGQFSFRSQRTTMPKNVQTTAQLRSFHMLARACSKSFKLGFSNMRTVNLRCSSWFEKRQRNQRSNCQHQLDHRKNKRVPEKHLFLLLLTMSKSSTVWITINWKILKEMGILDHLTCLLKTLYAGQEATVRTGHGTTDWFQIGTKAI